MENVFTRSFKAFGAALRRYWCFVLTLLTNFERKFATKPMYDKSEVVFSCFFFFWIGIEWMHNIKGALYHCVAIEDLYVQSFLYLAADGKRELILALYLPFRNLVLLLTVCSRFSPANSNLELCSRVGASVFAILTFCYRLIVIKFVMKRKTVKLTPLILCLFMFSSAVLWFVFGILQRDLFAAIPNGFAVFLGAWQLILYAKYRLNVEHEHAL